MALPRLIQYVMTGAAVLLAAQAHAQSAANVDTKRLLNADKEPGQWMSHSRTYDEQYFSPLKKINEDNIGKLGLAFYVDLPSNQNVETTPLMIDGVLYVTLPWSMVMAVDAKTGKQLWLHDPKVDKAWNGNICCGVDNRGAAAWNGKIIFGTLDGRLIALDAKTGKEKWSTKATPNERRYSITSAPRIANNMLFIGSAGAEFDVRGYIDAYNPETGKRLWRFWTIPGDPAKGFENKSMEMAADTWKTPGWWKQGGGGTVWDAITYDAVNDLVIFGTGNATPGDAVQRDPGRGDNLFTTSLVALHAKDGSYAWHYQPTPWETWDYDTDQQLMLLDVEINGQKRHTVMQASKNGFFYVLDAKTGKLLSAKPYTDVNWATGVDLTTGRPIEVPEARPNVTNKLFNLVAGPAGGHAWQSMSYSPITRLVYIPATTHWQLNGPGGSEARQKYLAENPTAKQTFSGRLMAWDPIAQKEVWRSEEFLNPTGGVQVTAGALATAGNLVFHGNLPKREFAAYRATDGKRLWVFDTKTAVLANPISYEVGGDQYVAIAVGGPVPGGYYAPNGSRLLVFKQGGKAVLPDLPQFTERPIAPPPQFADAATIRAGAAVFDAQCQLCHGRNGAARSTFPDLRRSPALESQALLDAIVLQGSLSQRGMASFRQYLKDGDTVALRAYLISVAEAAARAPTPVAAPVMR